jgi:anti-anti-sigma factor
VSDLATLRIREREGVVIATVTGEIDVSNAGVLLGDLAAGVANSAAGLLLDLSDVEFMDSSGVHMLYDLAERLANRQQVFAVVIPADRPPRRTVELSGVKPVEWLHEDGAAALAALGAQ